MNWIIQNKGKTVALLISIFYLVLTFNSSAERGFKMLMFLLLPLACIFFSKEMGSYTGFSGLFNPPINERSPGFIIQFLGWILLLLPVIIGIIAGISKAIR